MRTYILKRVIEIVPTVLMITFVVFVMMRSVPGDPVVPLLGDAYTEEDAIKVRQAYGLDKPVPVQYVIWLGKLVQGDWGTSILSGRPAHQHARGHPDRVRHHRPRQGPGRAPGRAQARAEERAGPDRDGHGTPGRLPDRGRHRGRDALRHAGARDLRHRRDHRARLPTG